MTTKISEHEWRLRFEMAGCSDNFMTTLDKVSTVERYLASLGFSPAGTAKALRNMTPQEYGTVLVSELAVTSPFRYKYWISQAGQQEALVVEERLELMRIKYED